MTEREAVLLIGLVTDYIRTGTPVGSLALARGLKLDRSPATIRADLHQLEEEGYIWQPHTSAGRIPTDKGYRFFVDHVRERGVAAAQRERMKEQLTQLMAAHQQLARMTAQFLSAITDTPVLSSSNDPPAVFESGLRELIHHSTETTLDELKELTALLKQLDERMAEKPLPAAPEQANVYIGEENPLMTAHYSSMVVRDVATPDGQTMTLVIIGPKRMPYQRNVALLNAVAEIIEQESRR
jgi:transcriptional regulator of heat shock response